MTHNEYWYWLCNLKNIGIKKMERLLEFYKTPEHIFEADSGELIKYGLLKGQDINILIESRNPDRIRTAYNKLEKKGVRFISRESEEYPQKLLEIYDAPMGIYVRGKLPPRDKPAIAVVGSRECSFYGKETALYFASELSRAGVLIISGMAVGIDGYAHWGALTGGSTYAVLGCGVDICYPRENIELYRRIPQAGGVLSEYEMGTPPCAGHFPQRNRIISGLSDGILVVEAKEKSGSLITAELGLEQGKEIYAVPGRITDCFSQGCNQLIQAGAKCVGKPSDILEDFKVFFENLPSHYKKNKDLLETKEKIVYASLSLDAKHMEQIMTETGLGMTEIIKVLLRLEMKGYIRQVRKNYYIQALEI